MDRNVIIFNGIWKNRKTDPLVHFTRTIGPYQVKHWLKQFGIGVQIIDFAQLFTGKELADLAEHFISKETFAIGASTTFWSGFDAVSENIRDAVLILRDKHPNLKFIGGGARLPPKKSQDLWDMMFSGEAENKMGVWCQDMMNQKNGTKKSIQYRLFDITKLDHRFDDQDAIMYDEVLPIEMGRGCIFKCKFCGHHNIGKPKNTYQRKYQLVLDEMRYNLEHFGTTKYNFLDDTVNEDLEKIRNLSNIEHDLGTPIMWTGYLRADLVWAKKEEPELLAKSGMRSCFFGIETYNRLAAKSIDKGWGAKHGKEYLPKLYKEIWGEKINIHISLIVGLPTETPESIAETFKWSMQNDIGWHWFNPLTLYTEKKDPAAMSEFTRNQEENGYVNVRDDGYWENGVMNSTMAQKLSAHYNRIMCQKINRVSSWSQFSGLNMGYSIDEIRTWKMIDFINKVEHRIGLFKEKYVKQLMAVKI